MKFIAYYDSPLGKITLAGDGVGLCGLWFESEKYYAHALATSSADKKQGSTDLLAKEQRAASETQRDFAAKAASGADGKFCAHTLIESEKFCARDFAAEAESGTDVKFCANVLVASEKFCARDFTAQSVSKKSYATNLSAQGASEKICANEQSGYFEGKNLAVFDQTRRWLDLYFSGREPGFTPALNPAGSAFRRAVWEILLKIPYGKTTTYGQIAREIAAVRGLAKMSAQAVGGAVGHNEISIIIPCHRVIGAHGNLTGYAGGIDRKIKLLQLEGVDMQGLFTPAKGTAL
ncbi:methylated-DNA--[protein]-cysteine S-methyltransferase [uncultured Campylobacter sp.]|uniref:methylated-DNA--[protein]-cysteine S-methyltransferase n=1 Tax=uncultured Campylobacter sp. TaxID=218934 RepID=UPI0026223C06|nr:methylated-DNA--[protein]-cysteine S-methyltransferase [uncultured Campylobacter sp.]